MDRAKSDAATRAVRVFLLVGNRLLRDTLLRLFRKPADVSIVGQGSPATTVSTEVEESECDVVLSDSIPIAATPPEVAPAHAGGGAEILLVGMEDDEEQFRSAIRSGSTGYLLKDASAADVLSAVRSVSRGEAVCPPRLCLSLFKWIADEARELTRRETDSRPSLTMRQQQLVSLVARGLTNKEIASQLNLSEFTVKNHLHRIMKQVDAESRHEAVESARAHGYLTQQ